MEDSPTYFDKNDTLQKPDIVIAGDTVYAGIGVDDRSVVNHAIVIQFKDKVQMQEALDKRSVNFTLFGEE